MRIWTVGSRGLLGPLKPYVSLFKQHGVISLPGDKDVYHYLMVLGTHFRACNHNQEETECTYIMNIKASHRFTCR